ncbi:MAG: type II secretion system major pseudopilin GspG, partial [Nitrospinaceae bacterium]
MKPSIKAMQMMCIRNQRPAGQRADGFTLLEMIMVIVILGFLIGLVAPKFFGQVDKARQTDAQAQIEMMGQALDLYRLEKGRYPSTQDGLAVLKSYLKKAIPKDPWGNEFHYESPGQHGDYDL